MTTAPLLSALIIAVMNAYLGMHVVARKVIFVDLALAQIAALGTVTAVLLGYEVEHDPTAIYLISLAFTAVGALVFALTKTHHERVPHEALIGIVYAVAFALMLLVLTHVALGPHEIDRLLKGEITYAKPSMVTQLLAICGLVGLFHFVFRRQFFKLSFEAEALGSDRMRILWDFLFYMSFGFVVTSSVAIAGVFLVFSYLIIPAVAAMLFARRFSARLAIGWGITVAVTTLGERLSYPLDLPTSPLIVVLLGAALMLGAIGHTLFKSEARGKTAMKIGAGLAASALFGLGLWASQKAEEDQFEHSLHQLQDSLATERASGIAKLGNSFLERKKEWVPKVIPALKDKDQLVQLQAIETLAKADDPSTAGPLAELLKEKGADVRKKAAAALRSSKDPAIAQKLLQAADKEEEIDIQIDMLTAAVEMGSADAVDRLLDIGVDEKEGELFRKDAMEQVEAHVALDIPRGRHGSAAEWWTSHAAEIHGYLATLDDPKARVEDRDKAYTLLRQTVQGEMEPEDRKLIQTWWKARKASMTWDSDARKFRPK